MRPEEYAQNALRCHGDPAAALVEATLAVAAAVQELTSIVETLRNRMPVGP